MMNYRKTGIAVKSAIKKAQALLPEPLLNT